MSRSTDDRYRCDECGAVLVYEKACPCCTGKGDHAEMCCGQPMSKVPAGV